MQHSVTTRNGSLNTQVYLISLLAFETGEAKSLLCGNVDRLILGVVVVFDNGVHPWIVYVKSVLVRGLNVLVAHSIPQKIGAAQRIGDISR